MKKKSLFSKLTAGAFALVLTLGMAGCGGNGVTETPPEVKNVTITAATSANQGKTDSPHTLSYEVPEGSNVSVSVKKGSAAATADDFTYSVADKTLVFYQAGTYTVTVNAAKDGLLGSATGQITVTMGTPADANASETDLPQVAEWTRIAVNTDCEIPYRTYEGYNVSFKAPDSRITAKQGKGNTVKVKATEMDTYTVTVTYTNKENSTDKKQAVYKVCAVSDTTYSPVFVGDPFGGMPSEILTNIGHQLYFSAVPAVGSAGRTLGYNNVKYEVISRNLESPDAATSAEILYAYNHGDYPYVLINNLDKNNTTGTVKVKMTVTDPATGEYAVSTKQFTVLSLSSNKEDKNLNDYVKKYGEFFNMGDMSLKCYKRNNTIVVNNLVLTRDGLVFMGTDRYTGNVDFATMEYATAANDCRLEFRMTIIGKNRGKLWLGVGLRTGKFDGWAGYLDLYDVDGKLAVGTGIPHSGELGAAADYEPVTLEEGTVLYFRLDRRVIDGTAVYRVYVKTAESANYAQVFSFTAEESTADGNAGKAVKAYQFSQRNSGGCYLLSDVTLSTLG